MSNQSNYYNYYNSGAWPVFFMFENPIFAAMIVGFGVTFFVSLILVLTKHIHGRISLDTDHGVQKFHHMPTPRIGGIPLIFGYLAAWFFLEGDVKAYFGLIGLAGLPALAFGLAEDISKKVGVRTRLIATIVSGMIFAALSGYTITHVDIWGVDALLALPLFAFAFTAFAIGGAANAINLIDGFHGLASGTLIIILLSFALVGWRVEDVLLMNLSIVMAVIIVGFFIINFPFGKLFLGDAGAYFAGYFVAVLAVMLPARNPEVSPWVSLLILGYPVTETLVSVVRRLLDSNAHPGEPDCAHLHHVVHRTWAKRLATFIHIPQFQNPLTSIFMWTLPGFTFLAAAMSGLQSIPALGFLAGTVVFYVASYRFIVMREENSQKADF